MTWLCCNSYQLSLVFLSCLSWLHSCNPVACPVVWGSCWEAQRSKMAVQILVQSQAQGVSPFCGLKYRQRELLHRQKRAWIAVLAMICVIQCCPFMLDNPESICFAFFVVVSTQWPQATSGKLSPKLKVDASGELRIPRKEKGVEA